MQIKALSADSLIIYFSDFISKETHNEVKSVYTTLLSLKIDAFIEVVPSYNSILITYDIFEYDYSSIKTYLERSLSSIVEKEEKSSTLVTIDVYYGEEVSFDLNRVAKLNKLSIEEVVEIHTSKIYDVYAIGFLPGFAYLASIDDKIKTSRLETPRKSIPKGSVAIADNQTAVYPQNSPGGWNILGKTTFEFFDKSLENLSSIDFNSKIKFNSISKEQFLEQGGSFEF